MGNKQCIALKVYSDWVQARARTLKMPYLLEEPSLPIDPHSSSIISIENSEEYQGLLDRIKLERDTWEKKFHVSEIEKEE